MSGPRVVLVTRRYWPLAGDAELTLAQLAGELLRQGARPLVLTARWDPDWPTEVVYRGVPVIRLRQPSTGLWGTICHLQTLAAWLRCHQSEIDAVYVASLRYEAFVALRAMRSLSVPVVVRAEGLGASGDCRWQSETRLGGYVRRRCFTAAAIVASSETQMAELSQAKYPRERIHYIPTGVASPEPRSPERRAAARAAVAEANSDLRTSDDTAVLLSVARLDKASAWHELLRCYDRILSLRPKAQAWLIGDGPERDRLYDHIRHLGLRQQIFLPGTFANREDLFQAADLFVEPPTDNGGSLALLEAMAAGLPVVATNNPANRELIEPGRHGLLVAPGNVVRLSEEVDSLLMNGDLAAALCTAARQRVEGCFGLTRMAAEHLRLWERLGMHA